MVRALVFALLVLLPSTAEAQSNAARDTADGWNSQSVRALMERARARRQQPRGDTALTNYTAKASGNIYFFLDRTEGEERTLVKVNQIALQLYWAAPNLTKQRIVGLRDANPLPNRMYYHLDHLTVVQNGFSDVIRIGDGDEVRDVRHPAAPLSDSAYDFRLADSLTLTFPPQPPVRVFEVQVRPRNYNQPALIGSLFIDQASADIVRMTFTFTPASYVDRRLDYINISLDNGLWSGRYWLPNEQYVEIRRQIPELDFAAGAVIRGRLRVYDYQFNQNLPRNFFYGPGVEAAPEAERKSFPFEENIFGGLEREGLTEPPQIATLRSQAMEIVRRKKLSGLPPLRPHIAGASSVFRHNSTEGTFLGLGALYAPTERLRFDLRGGYAFAQEQPEAELRARHESESGFEKSFRAYVNEPRDQGIRSALPGALNTLSSVLFDRDYLNLYFARGGALKLSKPALGKGEISFTGGYEEQLPASLTASLSTQQREFAAATNSGTEWFGKLSLRTPDYSVGPIALRAELAGGAYHFLPNQSGLIGIPAAALGTTARSSDVVGHPTTFGSATASLTASHEPAGKATALKFQLSHGTIVGDPPFQQLFILGGLGTIPGATYRGMIGKSYTLFEAEAARDVWAPWVRLRVNGAAGIIRNSRLPSAFPQTLYREAASVGVGVGLFWDILQFDVVRGRDFSRFYFSVRRDLWDLL